jgi:Tfp pilus assembly protein PilF
VVLLALGVGACALAEKERQEKEVRRLQARSVYETSLKHLQEQRVSLGLSGLQQAIALDPENVTYHNSLGVLYLELKRPADAQPRFETAVSLDPRYAEAYHNLGLAHAEQGRWEQAVASYRKALSFPTYASPEVAYNNLGNALQALQRLGEAEDAYRAAIRLSPTMPSAHYGLGVVLFAQGRREEARIAFMAARDIDTSSPFSLAAAEALKALGSSGDESRTGR